MTSSSSSFSSSSDEVLPLSSPTQFTSTEEFVGALRHRFSVCQIKRSNSSGTGFLIAPGVIITCAHVFREINRLKDPWTIAPQSQAITNAKGAHACFETLNGSLSVRLNPDPERGGCFYDAPAWNLEKGAKQFTLDQLDFALVALDQVDPSFGKIKGLAVPFFQDYPQNCPTLQLGDTVYVMQYPIATKNSITNKTIVLSDQQKFVPTQDTITHIGTYLIHYKGASKEELQGLLSLTIKER